MQLSLKTPSGIFSHLNERTCGRENMSTSFEESRSHPQTPIYIVRNTEWVRKEKENLNE